MKFTEYVSLFFVIDKKPQNIIDKFLFTKEMEESISPSS